MVQLWHGCCLGLRARGGHHFSHSTGKGARKWRTSISISMISTSASSSTLKRRGVDRSGASKGEKGTKRDGLLEWIEIPLPYIQMPASGTSKLKINFRRIPHTRRAMSRRQGESPRSPLLTRSLSDILESSHLPVRHLSGRGVRGDAEPSVSDFQPNIEAALT
jgi:hypothetical protein